MYACFKRRNSDSAAMAARSTDLVTNQEPAEVQEECSGKKKSKFRTFRKLFARKKRKEPQITGAEEGLKGSQSSDDVSKASENNALTRSEKDKGSGSKISLGNKALSHDSVFVSESSEANEGLGASQDSIHGKVKSLQLQLKQAIRLGSPPSLMCVKKTEDAGTMSEDDGLPCSPPDYRLLHSVKSKAERSSSNSLHGIDSDEQLSCAASGGAASPPAVPGDFSQPASPFVCLDNSAAKHKLGLRNKACNGRKPARRLELKAEADSAAEEELMVSLAVADMWEEEEQQRAEVESVDHLKPKAESDGEEDEEEDRSQRDSLTFLPGDEEAEDEPETEQDVSHAPEEDPSDDQHVPCSATSSRSSSLDSPSDTTESPAGPITYLAGPPGSPCDVDDGSESGSSSEEDGSARESTEEESSLLEEVLSSLKTSHSANMEIGGAVLEETETESVTEIDEREVEEEDEAAACEAAALCANPTADEEEVGEKPEVLFHPSQQEEVPVEEEEKTTEDEVYEDEEEEEEILVEGRIQQNDVEEAGRGEEDAAEAASEEENDDVVSSQTVNQEEAEDEQDGGEEEEEAAEVKEGPETAEEELDNRKEEICVEVDDGGEAEEEMTELVRDPEDEEVLSRSSSPGAGERDDGATSDDTTPEMDDQELPTMNEGEGILGNPSGGEEEVEEGELQGSKSEDEEEQEVERSPSDADGSEDDLDWGEVQTSSVGDVEPLEAGEEGGALSKAPPMPFPESDESPVSSPSKTASLHINLTSPTSEKPVSLLALRSAADDGRDTSHVTSATNELQEAASDREEEEEDKESPQERNHPAPEAMQEVSAQPTDQSNVRFTIAPAWQRLQSPPSPPSAVPELQDDGAEARAASQKHLDLKADTGGPPKAEPVLSPSRARSSGSFTSEPRSRAPSSPAELQTAASPRTSEKASVAEANPDSPFGVRLRKTSAALVRLGSEEASSEPQAESPRHPPSSKAESPQEIGSKPALPKKPEVQLRRISEPAAARGLSGRTDPPSWISVAKQKQKVYKETPLNEIAVKKEEQEKKPILPTSASKEPSNDKTVEPTRKVSAEKETRKTLSVPTPVPPKPLLQKPQVPPVSAKPAPRPDSNQTPRSAPLKSPGPAAPSILSKATPVTSPSVSPRTVQEKPGSRAAGFSRQAAPHQRGSPPAALPQNDPPWMALAKKKAKAWSEMPQIVQ